MPLTPAQDKSAQAVFQHLKTCSVCANPGPFVFGEIILPPFTSRRGSLQSPGNVPMLEVVCTTCHHIALFAAIPLGLP
jgi:hypothetical protein